MIKCKLSCESAPDEKLHRCCTECDSRGSCEVACEESPDTCGFTMDQEQPDTKRLIEITREIKALQEQEKQIKERIKTAMEKGGEKEIKIDAVKIVYVAETVIKGIDTKTLALEMPDIAAKYAKETKKSAYIKVTEGK